MVQTQTDRMFQTIKLNYNSGQIFTGFTVAPVTTAVPCTCKDKEDDCKGYGVDMCYDASYRRFAKSQCAAYCDLCKLIYKIT